jgi:uncharacterized protein (TIGR00303 family)
MTRLVLVGGTTATARIEGISAAGADPAAMAHTPAADLEIVEFGRPVDAPIVPVSPTGCPTPAVLTRAAREAIGVDATYVDAGLPGPTAAPTRTVADAAGGDIREQTPVPQPRQIFDAGQALGRELGRELSHDGPGGRERLLVGETIPGGTTTALGVLTALGERPTVSSSLPENPLPLKRSVVEAGLGASGLAAGDAAGEPWLAVAAMGDPVLPAVAGIAHGALGAGGAVTLAGGTQLAAAGALLRHGGVDDPLALATTSHVASDDSADIRGLAADLDLDLCVTDPGFSERTGPVADAYGRGEAKEGVGLGGALALLDRSSTGRREFHRRVDRVYETVTADARAVEP